MRKQIAVFVLAALSPLGLAQAKDAADLILYNGKVLTVDKDFSVKSAVVVKDGKILAVGGDDLAKTYTMEYGAKAMDSVIQTFGAMGMTNEMGFGEAWLMMRRTQIADGTRQILRRTIVKEMLAGDMRL